MARILAVLIVEMEGYCPTLSLLPVESLSFDGFIQLVFLKWCLEIAI